MTVSHNKVTGAPEQSWRDGQRGEAGPRWRLERTAAKIRASRDGY